MIVIGYHLAHGIISTSRNGVIPCLDLDDILTEFLEPYEIEGQQTWKVAWDIDDLVIPVLRLLPRELLQTLGEKESVEFNLSRKDGTQKRYRLWYPRSDGVGQAFAVTDKTPGTKWGERPEMVIWHLLSHMPDGIEPPKDAIEVELYARKVLDIFAKQLRFTPVPGKFFSPVNVVKPYVQAMDLPSVSQLHSKVANYASKCMSPPWVEAHQIGYWERATDVDLSNAYAGILRDLPDWRLGRWVESKEFQPEATFGYCATNLTIRPEAALHPILTELEESKEGMTVSATGLHREKYLTKAQIKFIQNYKLGEVEILDGVWWFADKLRQPLKTVIQRLTTQREDMAEQLKDSDRLMGRFLAKKVMVGLWGYTARWDWEKGKAPDEFYNPPWAAEITTRIPLKVAAFIYRKKLMKHVICLAVDGFNADCNIEVTPEDEDMGWKLSEVGPTLCLSSHHSWMGKRRPEGLYLGEIVKAIKAKPSSNLWSRVDTRRATLGDCMLRENLSLLGTTIEVPSTVYLKQDHNRKFRPAPRTGKDLLTKTYRSKPITMGG